MPTDKQIIAARQIVKAETLQRNKLARLTGIPQRRVYGLIKKIADHLTTKEIKRKKNNAFSTSE